MNSDFNIDNNFSSKCNFDEYYFSENFQKKIQQLYKRGKVEVVKIDRSQSPIFQAENYLDAVISLSTGTCLKIDEKAWRYNPQKPEYLNNVCVEVVSNPNKDGKHDGWGYHVNTTMCGAHFDVNTFEMKGEPVIFNINHSFVEEITRNNEYELKQNKPTNGLYTSSFRVVPRNVIEKYWP